MKSPLLFGLCMAMALSLAAQDDLPTDYLSPAFHAGRRDALRKLMPDSSVAVIFAYPTRTFSNDVAYTYHPNPDLYYFSGYTEPNAVLLIFKQPVEIEGRRYKELFFVQKRDARSEQWTGRRLGWKGVMERLGFDTAFDGSAFRRFPVPFEQFSKVFFSPLPDDMADDRNDPADLFDLVKQFREKSGMPPGFDAGTQSLLAQLSQYATGRNLAAMQAYLKRSAENKPAMLEDESVKMFLACRDSADLAAFRGKMSHEPFSSTQLTGMLASLREIKTPEEMDIMRKAISISSIAHAEVMKAVEPGMSEREIQGLQEYIHKRYGAENVGYPSIVGAGPNGCVLHYEENAKMHVGNDMVLMDVGAEYHGYSADVTRTIPPNGKFSPEQKAIYNLVYEAQEAVFLLCKNGTPFSELNKTAREVLANGLLKLGIIKNKSEVDIYYPHGCSHFLGLDVHDAGNYGGELKENMVITVEPGIYIPPNSKCDKKWWGIAVRIEDDVRVGKDQFELLSYQAPRKAEDVEKMIAVKSVLEDYKLPALNDKRKGF